MRRKILAAAPCVRFLAFGVVGSILISLLMSKPPPVGCAANPSDFCYRTDLSITNSTGADLTNYGVRFPFPAAAIISADQMDEHTWDLRMVTPGNEDVELFAQDLTGGTATWWLRAPTIPDGATVTYKIYTVVAAGTPGLEGRDPGFFFSTAATSTMQVSHHADFNLTNRIGLQVTAENDGAVPPTSPAWLLSKHNGSSGYRVGIIDDGGTLRVRFQIDGTTLDAGWTGDNTEIRGEFITPNMTIYMDGVLAATTAGGPGSAATSTTPLLIGEDFDGVVREARVVSNVGAGNTVISRWGMEPQNATEISDTLPFTGTIGDNVGAHPADYTLGWAQTGITLSLSALGLTETASTIIYDPDVVGVIGTPFDFDPFEDTGCTPNESLPMYGSLSGLCALSGLPVEGCFIAIFTTIAMVALLVTALYSPHFLIGIVPLLLILSFGAANCFYSWWYVFLWGMIGASVAGVRVLGKAL